MKLKYYIALLALPLLLAGCTNAIEYTPSVYILDSEKEISKTVTIYADGDQVDFSVGASNVVHKDTKVTLSVRNDLVELYNQKYGKTCISLDENSFELAQEEVIISAGTNVSQAVKVIIKKKPEPGKFYCLPVQISSIDGPFEILAPSSTLYLILRSPVTSKGVYIGSSNKYIVPAFNDKPMCGDVDLSNLNELTLECRVNVSSFQKYSPYISSVMGLEGNVCLRFGDVKIGWNVLQSCMADYQPAAVSRPCDTDKWYHVATVWSRQSLKIYIDGKFVTETATQGEPVDITQIQKWQGYGIGFGLGAASNYDNNRPLFGYLAEARVWSKALSPNEIANVVDLVVVDPQSPGLVAYWKMNEAQIVETPYREPNSYWYIKNEIKDLTGHGYNALGLSGSPTFIEATW